MTRLEFMLLIPSIQVYCATDTIPFHLQLLGSEDSVKDLFAPRRVPSTAKPVVRLALVRQVNTNIDGEKSWRNIILDQASFHPVPSSYPEDTDTEVLNWNGTMRPKGVEVGSFITKGLNVMVLSLSRLVPRKTLTEFTRLVGLDSAIRGTGTRVFV
jgi:hypothetical protein